MNDANQLPARSVMTITSFRHRLARVSITVSHTAANWHLQRTLTETSYRHVTVTGCALTVTDVAVAGNSGTMTVTGDFVKIAIKCKLS